MKEVEKAFMVFSERMTAAELRISIALASVFGLRMFGMFMIFPVFALYAHELAGGHDAMMVGLAMGAYGLMQAIFQIPLGWASDRWGRKPVIYFGLGAFILGSVLAALADNMVSLIIGRAVQGMGAISAVVMALVADLTRDTVRTKAMAIIGATIGLSFGLSLVLSPILAPWGGLSGLFILTGCLACMALLVVWQLPTPQAQSTERKVVLQQWQGVVFHPQLLQLNLAILVLHVSLGALFVEFPAILVAHGIPSQRHWLIYLVIVFPSFLLIYPFLRRSDQATFPKYWIFLAFLFILGGVSIVSTLPASLVWLLLGLLLFFCGFNYLEASLPAWISRLAPTALRGTAISFFTMAQFLGSFMGPAIGGWFLKTGGSGTATRFAAVAVLSWLFMYWRDGSDTVSVHWEKK